MELKPTMELRFVKRDSKFILQQKFIKVGWDRVCDDVQFYERGVVWEDVPVVEEETLTE